MDINPSNSGPALHQSHRHSPFQMQVSSFAEASYQARQSSITMKTEEGDVITISSAAAAGINMNYVDWQSTNSSGTNFTASLSQEKSLQISVQGDLNEEELADMKKLMQELHKVSTAFFAGNMEESVQHALAIGDMGSIRELEASFQYSSQIATSYTSRYHPLPESSINDLQHLQDAVTEGLGPTQLQDFGDLLQAQWRQLQDFLEQQDNGTPDIAPASPEEMNLAGLLQKMQDLIGETIGKHPRLSPLAVPVTDKALQSAAADHRQAHHDRVANHDRRFILGHLRDWIIAG